MTKEEFKRRLIYSREDLKRLQALTLEEKETLSRLRIEEWYEHWSGKVYVSYSGGKDSTVLLSLVREMYPEVTAVYVDSGLDLPSVREFVRRTSNVTFLKPELNFRQVIERYGFVFPSKDVAQTIEHARRGVPYALKYLDGKNYDGSESEFKKTTYGKWKKLLNAPFKISAKCCEVLKEEPLRKYERKTKAKGYVGLMAEESHRRADAWRRTGCNVYEGRAPKSKPLSFWTEQDILRFIKNKGLEIPAAYGEIVETKKGLRTTGEQRTGCIFCLIGAHLNKPNRIERLKESCPSKYKYCIEQLGMGAVMEWLKIPY